MTQIFIISCFLLYFVPRDIPLCSMLEDKEKKVLACPCSTISILSRRTFTKGNEMQQTNLLVD